MDAAGDLDSQIEAGTTDYWRARARQWETRCKRAEKEKTELIVEVARLKKDLAAGNQRGAVRGTERDDRRRAIIADGALGGTSGPPSARGWA